jgi:hypothetical protein
MQSKIYFKAYKTTKLIISKYSSILLIVSLYLILTVIMLYPFSILESNNQLIGMDAGDTYQGLWSLWWVKYSVVSLTNPYSTNHIFYPLGTDLYAHTLSPAAGLFSIPFQLAGGLIFSYNFLIILSFVLSGYGAFLLSKHIINDQKASFLAGLVYAFSTYHFARAWGHQNLVSIQWIPFYVLFLLKVRKERSKKNVLFGVFFLLLTTFWADFQYAIFLGVFTLLVLFYDVLFNRQIVKKYILRFSGMVCIYFGFLVIILGPFFLGLLAGEYTSVWSSITDEAAVYSADLVAFFIPSNFNSLFGNSVASIVSNLSNPWIEGIVYIGWTVLILTIYASFKVWKKARFWILGAISFMILSSGPILHIYGNSTFTDSNLTIPLPEWVITSILSLPRAPSRFVVMTMLCLSVVSAISFANIDSWVRKLKHGKILGVLLLFCISGAMLAEVNMIPFPVVENSSIPTFYSNMTKMNDTFSVLDLPHGYDESARWMYFGTASEKPLVVGSISRVSQINSDFLQVFPAINQMNYALQGKEIASWEDILSQNQNQTNLNAFHFFNIKYVILHRSMCTANAYENMNNYLLELLGQPVYSDEHIRVYETRVSKINNTFAYLSKGWAAFEEVNKIRWMRINGTVNIVSQSSQFYDLSLEAATQVSNKQLQIFLNGERIIQCQIFVNEFSAITLEGLYLKEGLNELLFYSDDYFIPAKVNENSSDFQQLSIAFRNIRIEPAK